MLLSQVGAQTFFPTFIVENNTDKTSNSSHCPDDGPNTSSSSAIQSILYDKITGDKVLDVLRHEASTILLHT